MFKKASLPLPCQSSPITFKLYLFDRFLWDAKLADVIIFSKKIAPTPRRGFIFCKISDKIHLSLSDPKAVVQGEGVITMLKLILEVIKKIVESIIKRSIYDWFKSLFEDND